MKCTEVRMGLLEAELPVLEGLGDDPVAQHIRECSGCAEKARTILRGEASLARALEEAAPFPDLDRILDAAGIEPPEAIPLQPRGRSWSRSRTGLTLLPLAAAAAIAALFLGRDPSLPGPPYTPPEAQAGLDVEVPEGNSVVVLETNNSEITVLWLF